MALIGTISALLTADSAKWNAGMKSAGMSAGGLAGGMAGVAGAVGAFAAAAAAAGAAAAATLGAVLTKMTLDGMQAADELQTLANVTGIGVEALSELQLVAKLGDVEFATFAQSLKKLNKNLYEAASTGKGPAADAFRELGLSARELSGMQEDQQLELIADAFAKLGNQGQATALAMDLFGKSGADMVPILTGGGEAIKKTREEARLYGISLTQVDSDRINAANDTIDKMMLAWKGVGMQLASAVAPMLTDLGNKLLNSGIFGQAMGARIQIAISGAAIGLRYFLDLMQLLYEGWQVNKLIILGWGRSALWAVTQVANVLDGVLQRLHQTDTGLSALLKSANDGIDKEIKETFTSLSEGFTKQTWGEGFQQWFSQVNNNANNVASAVKNMATEIEGVDDAAAKAAKSAAELAKSSADLISKLQLEKETFGMSSTAAEIYALKMKGADSATIKQATALGNQIGAMKAAKDWQDKFIAKQDSTLQNVLQSLETPFSKLKQEIQSALDLTNQGVLSADQFQLFRQKKLDDAGFNQVKFAGAVDFGSQAARSTLLNHQNQTTNPNTKALETAVKQLQVQIEQRNYMKKISEYIVGTPVATL